jgi:hypothetical protein
MADARAMVLPLVTTGDPDFVEHDWNTIFTSLGVLRYDTTIAAIVRTLGWCGMLACVIWLTMRLRATQRTDPDTNLRINAGQTLEPTSNLISDLRRRSNGRRLRGHRLRSQIPRLAIKMRG